MTDGRMSKEELRALASKVGSSIEGLAQEAKLNSQTLYRKKEKEKFGHKSTHKLLEAAEKIAGRNSRLTATG